MRERKSERAGLKKGQKLIDRKRTRRGRQKERADMIYQCLQEKR